MDEKDWAEDEYPRVNAETSQRSLPERMQKLESRAETQCVLEDEDMSSDTDKKLLEVEASKENAFEEARVVSHFVECVDKAKEIPDIEINLECEPLEALATEEETVNESKGSVFFPSREAPSQSVFVFDNSIVRSSANTCADTPLDKNTFVSKKLKNSTKKSSSNNTKKKDIATRTRKTRKGEKKTIEWPKPNPNFPFEPIKSSYRVDDDSVIHRYLEEYSAARSADSNLPLPDFGLPSFSNIKISRDEESESEKKKSPDTPYVHVTSSSLPSCSSMVI